MSTISLPSYIAPSVHSTPSYSAEPHHYEQRLAFADRNRPRPSGDFIKESKGAGIRLRLSAQEENATLPVYGSSDTVKGVVELSKTTGITRVEVQVRDFLWLRSILSQIKRRAITNPTYLYSI